MNFRIYTLDETGWWLIIENRGASVLEKKFRTRDAAIIALADFLHTIDESHGESFRLAGDMARQI